MRPGIVPRLAGSHGERFEKVDEEVGFELAGVALRHRRMPRGPMTKCQAEPMGKRATDGLRNVEAKAMSRAAGGANRHLRATVSGGTADGISRRKV
jgi:hypothetical protein